MPSVSSPLKTFFSRLRGSSRFQAVACSNCFVDEGLRIDTENRGVASPGECPRCGDARFKKLDVALLADLAHRFFVWGSMARARFGAAPVIQFNEIQGSSIEVPPWLEADLELFESALGVGFFYYGPRLWMVGEIDPLRDLQSRKKRDDVVQRILNEYPTRLISTAETFYRLRVNPSDPASIAQYDSPPAQFAGRGRLDSPGKPILYASPDLELCIHECRATADDSIYVASLAPKVELRLLDLSALLREEDCTEFESLDMAVHMLFLAGKHAYKITRLISDAARIAGYDGLIYPSYFSLLRIGAMPFETVYGISHRKIAQFHDMEQAKTIPNIALFGMPVAEDKVAVRCIDKLVLRSVVYNYHFGPVLL